ncbi:MAG: DUF1016 N-terminal domain-containing protein [Phycisphaerae bacterium]
MPLQSPRLEADLKNDLPEVKGFSARNLRLMIQFYSEYPGYGLIWQRAVAQLPWAHNVILIQKVKARAKRTGEAKRPDGDGEANLKLET